MKQLTTPLRLRSLIEGSGLKAHLIRGGIGIAGIQAANRVLALGMGIVLARMLGPEGYGVYAYAFAIMGVLMVIAEAGVPTLLMREVAASQACAKWGILRGALRRGIQFVALTATIVSLLGLLVLWWFADSLRAQVLYTTVLMLLVLPVSALCKTVAHAIMGLHRVVIGQAVNMLIRPLVVFIIVIVVFLVRPSLRQPQVAMAVQLFGALLVLFFSVLVLRYALPNESRTLRPKYKSHEWLKSALTFTLVSGAMIINNQVDIIMLGWFKETEDVGVYRVVTQSALLVIFIFQVASSVLNPSFAKFYARGDWKRLVELYKKSRLVIVNLTIPVVVVFVLAGKEILGIVFGYRYSSGSTALSILAVGYFLNILFGPVGGLLQMIGQEKITAYLLWVASFLNIALNFILIPPYGIDGAAVATSTTVFVYHAVLWLKYKQILVRKVKLHG